MNCPKCNKEFKENISLRKGFFCFKKIFSFFCVSCDFEKEKIIKISKENYTAEVIQLSNTINTTKQIYDTRNEKISNRAYYTVIVRK